MMTHPWRRFALEAFTMLGRPKQERSEVIVARAEEESMMLKRAVDKDDASTIALGVIACLFFVALIAIAIYFFVKKRRAAMVTRDVEAGTVEKRGNWWQVDSKESKLSEWWRQSHSIPERVEPPKTAGVRLSLQRIRSALTRKGALRGGASNEDSDAGLLIPPVKVVSPSNTIILPLHNVPQAQPAQTKPRYPSVLERGYRVPLYPVQDAPTDKSPPRSLTSPAPMHPITAAEHAVQRKVTLPPRALSVSKGRIVLPRSQRKMGLPRSPAERRSHRNHPFVPLKDSDTAFPVTISAPMPSDATAETNPKLGYPKAVSQLRAAPAPPTGPHLGRASTRRVPPPLYVPARPTTPATPLGLRETMIFPPGQSPAVRPSPMPL